MWAVFWKVPNLQVETINKIWRNMYFSAIQNFGEICEDSYSWPPIVMQLAQNPLNVVITLQNISLSLIWYPIHGEMRFRSNTIFKIPQYYFHMAAISFQQNIVRVVHLEVVQGSPLNTLIPNTCLQQPMSGGPQKVLRTCTMLSRVKIVIWPLIRKMYVNQKPLNRIGIFWIISLVERYFISCCQ